MSKRTRPTCTHPEDRHYYWTVYDPAQEGNYMCMGCTVCGHVLAGAVKIDGTPVGQQHRLSRRKGKSKKATVLATVA